MLGNVLDFASRGLCRHCSKDLQQIMRNQSFQSLGMPIVLQTCITHKMCSKTANKLVLCDRYKLFNKKKPNLINATYTTGCIDHQECQGKLWGGCLERCLGKRGRDSEERAKARGIGCLNYTTYLSQKIYTASSVKYNTQAKHFFCDVCVLYFP